MSYRFCVFSWIIIVVTAVAESIAAPGDILWSYQTLGQGIGASPAIGRDNTLYVVSASPAAQKSYLYALYYDGTPKTKWVYEIANEGQAVSSPAIGIDGTIYFGDGKYVSAINSLTGKIKWRYETSGIVGSSPALGRDGTIYVGSGDNCLYAINPDNTLKWKHCTSGTIWISSPAIGADGTIYIGSTDDTLYAVHPNGDLKWKFGTIGDIESTPAIGKDGTIFFGAGDMERAVYALNPDGSLKWRAPVGTHIRSSPAIHPDGTVYIAGMINNRTYKFRPEDGSRVCDFRAEHDVYTSPVIGADGTVYVADDWNVVSGGRLYALSPDSCKVLWSRQYFGGLICSPVIGPDGTIYLGTFGLVNGGKVIAIEGAKPWTYDDYLTAMSVYADSPWPRFGQNNFGTRRDLHPNITLWHDQALIPADGIYDFGFVSQDSSRTTQLTITNSGEGPMTVDRVSLDASGPFTVNGAFPVTLVNNSAALEVTFSPSQRDFFAAQVTVHNNLKPHTFQVKGFDLYTPVIQPIPDYWQPNAAPNPERDAYPYLDLKDYISDRDTPIDQLHWTISIRHATVHDDNGLLYFTSSLAQLTDTATVIVTDPQGLADTTAFRVNLYTPTFGEYNLPEAVFVINPERLSGTAAELDSLLGLVYQTAQFGEYPGQVIDAGKIARAEYENWDGIDVQRANVIVQAIKTKGINPLLVDDYVRLKQFVILIGPDSAIPHFALENPVEVFRDADQYQNKVNDSTHLGYAIRHNYMLTDNAYGAPKLGYPELADPNFPLPAHPIGRLIESSSDILQYLNQYLQRQGKIRPQAALVFDYDPPDGLLIKDCADSVAASLASGNVAVTHLTGNETTLPRILERMSIAQIIFPLSHALHYEMDAFGSVDFAPINLTARLNGPLVYSPACYLGFNAGSEAKKPQDFAAEYLKKGASVFIGNWGAGFAFVGSVGYSEKVMVDMTREMIRRFAANEPVETGILLRDVEHQYVQTRVNAPGQTGYVTGHLDDIDVKVLTGLIHYGLPMYQLLTPSARRAATPERIMDGNGETLVVNATYDWRARVIEGDSLWYVEASIGNSEGNTDLDVGYSRTIQPIYYPPTPTVNYDEFRGFLFLGGRYRQYCHIPPEKMYFGSVWANQTIQPLFKDDDDYKPIPNIPNVNLRLSRVVAVPLGEYNQDEEYQRVLTHFELRYLNSPLADRQKPRVLHSDYWTEADSIYFRVIASDALTGDSDIDSVYLTVTDWIGRGECDQSNQAEGDWRIISLKRVAATDTFYLVLPFDTDKEFYFQVVDRAMNITTHTDDLGYDFLAFTSTPKIALNDCGLCRIIRAPLPANLPYCLSLYDSLGITLNAAMTLDVKNVSADFGNAALMVVQSVRQGPDFNFCLTSLQADYPPQYFKLTVFDEIGRRAEALLLVTNSDRAAIQVMTRRVLGFLPSTPLISSLLDLNHDGKVNVQDLLLLTSVSSTSNVHSINQSFLPRNASLR